MRVGGQALAVHLPAKVEQLFLADAPFEKSPGVDTRSRVPLNIKKVAAVILAGRTKEMVEAHVIEGGRGSKAGDMAAQGRIDPVRLNHHGHGVPPNNRSHPMFETRIPGPRLLTRLMNRVDIGGVRAVRQVGSPAPGATNQSTDEVVSALDASALEYRIQRIQPFRRFGRILVPFKVFCPGSRRGSLVFTHIAAPISLGDGLRLARERVEHRENGARSCAPSTRASSLRNNGHRRMNCQKLIPL